MRLLITGGYGFIGSNLIKFLLSEGNTELRPTIDRLVNLDKITYAANPENLSEFSNDDRYFAVHGDICNSELLSKIFREHSIDAVIHLAAESHVDRSIDSPEAFITTNTVGTFRLLEAANVYRRQRLTSLPTKEFDFRFLHVSTDEVYGSLETNAAPFTEITPYAPNSPYSASKAGSDHLARAYFQTYGLPVITTNCSNNYGPWQFPEKLVPLMISKIRRSEPLPIYGDGSQRRDWLYVEDHCRALTQALLKGRPGEVYNIGGRNEMSNLEVVRTLVSLVDEFLPEGESRSAEDLIHFVTDRPGHDHRYAIDCSKIEAEFGWHPQESPASGFRKTVQWYFENESWVNSILSGSYQGERLGARV